MVLYFYPKDNTPGCTRQACAFAGAYKEFEARDIVVIGISKDSVASHLKFAQKYDLPFILLADPELLSVYPYWENFGSQIDKATGLPSVLWYDEFVEVLTVESQRILLGEVSVEEGLATMQAKCEALEAEYAK